MQKVTDLHITSNNPLPSPKALCADIAPTSAQSSFIAESRQEIREILFGDDHRFLVIVGPCSIHDTDAGMEYARKLAVLAHEKDRL